MASQYLFEHADGTRSTESYAPDANGRLQEGKILGLSDGNGGYVEGSYRGSVDSPGLAAYMGLSTGGGSGSSPAASSSGGGSGPNWSYGDMGGGSSGGSGPSTGGSSGGGRTSSSGQPTFNLSSVATQGPTSWNVTKDQTVAGQLSSLLASDSPLMQQARTRAMQTAQSRGLLNSSMAASAGESAMYDAAMPIATADAQTHGDSARFNADAGNVFTRDSNAFARDAAMANFNLGANDWAALRAFEREQGGADAAMQREMELNRAARQQAAEIDAGAKAQAQTYDKEKAYINAINNARTDYAEKLAGVSDSTSMSEEVKNETIKNLQVSYNTIIRNYAAMLGWDANSWIITSESTGAGPSAGSSSQSAWPSDPNATSGGG